MDKFDPNIGHLMLKLQFWGKVRVSLLFELPHTTSSLAYRLDEREDCPHSTETSVVHKVYHPHQLQIWPPSVSSCENNDELPSLRCSLVLYPWIVLWMFVRIVMRLSLQLVMSSFVTNRSSLISSDLQRYARRKTSSPMATDWYSLRRAIPLHTLE